MGKLIARLVPSFVLVFAAFVQADDSVPTCLAYNRPLAINNEQILHWKRTTANQFRERGNVTGDVTRVFADASGHEHFEIQLTRHAEDNLEVIYNSDFGKIPEVKPGMKIQACGDFIVATAQSGPYPPSPSGAIIHWVHISPKPDRHPHGFLMIDGKLYGQDLTNADRRPRPGSSVWIFDELFGDFATFNF